MSGEERRTEEPSQRRQEQSREKGNAPLSKEVVSFFMLIAYAVLFAWVLGPFSQKVLVVMSRFIEAVPYYMGGRFSFYALGFSVIKFFLAPAALIVVFCIVAHFVQKGFLFSLHPLQPSFDKISPLKGFKRIFSFKSVAELINSVVKLCVICVVIFVAVKSQIPVLLELYDADMVQLAGVSKQLLLRIFLGLVAAMSLVAICDLLYRRYSHTKDIRMTPEELKDEMRQQELSPELKSRLKRVRGERLKHYKTMLDVAKADVVIANPEHYAVALKYEADTMPSPKVISKGKGYIAQQMKKIAYSKNVIVVENKVLAQVLYATVNVGSFIPAKHYRAVAEIINYVYKLKRGRAH